MAFACASCYNNRKAVMYIYGVSPRLCGATDVDAGLCCNGRKAAGIIVDLGGFSCPLHGQSKRVTYGGSTVLWCDRHTEHRLSSAA